MNEASEIARPIPVDDIPDYERIGPSLLAERKALFVRINSISLAGNLAQFVVILALAAVIAAIMPLQKIIPLFINIESGGLHETLRDLSELPQSKQEDVVKSVLWTFVLNREEYYWEGAPRRYALVSALSTGKAQTEYQTWFTRDPSSPQTRFGERGGHVAVEEVPNSANILDKIDSCQETAWCEATLSYWRTEKQVGMTASARKHYTANISFILVDQLDPGQRTTFNPAGLKVIAYHSDCDDCGT
jgi:type IV secretion system protein VirB8